MTKGILLLALLAFLLRAGFALTSSRPLQSDEIDYDRLGATLAATGHYVDDGHPTAYRSIGYPAFIAGLYAAGGHRPLLVKVAQGALDAGIVLLLALVLAPAGRAASTFGAAVWALYPPAILRANQLFTEALGTFLLFLAAALLTRAERGSAAAAALAGFALGIFSLVRSALAPIVAAVPYVAGRSVPKRVLFLALAASCLPAIVWMGRNAVVLGAPVLTTNMGVNLLIGNNPGSNGGYGIIQPATPVPDSGGELERDRAARRHALDNIVSDPARFLRLGVRGVAITASTEGELVVGAFLRTADRSMRFRDKLREVAPWRHFAVSAPYALVTLLGVLGYATRGDDAIGRLFLSTALLVAATSFVFFGSSRFHAPLAPFLAAFAAEFVCGLRERAPRLRSWRGLAAGVVCVGFVGVWAAELAIVYAGA